MIKKYAFSFLAVLGLCSAASAGIVTMVGTGPSVYGVKGGSDQFTTSGSSATGSFTFGAASDSVFAVTLFGFNANALAPSITLDPGGLNISLTPLVSAIATGNTSIQTFVFAANLGTVSAGALDFTVDWDTSVSNFSALGAAQAYQLSGTSIAGAVTNSSGGIDQSLPLNALPAGSFAITHLTDGGANAGVAYGTPSGAGGYSSQNNRYQNWAYYAGVSGNVITGVNGAGSGAQASVSAAFIAIPEPSTYALMAGFLALGGVLLGRRRRR